MDKRVRRAVIAGNWKMNKNRKEAQDLIEELKPLVKGADCDVIVCVPFVDLETALQSAEGSCIMVGAQNCHFKESGAFTGEISAEMLAELGVSHVVIGHSERRQYFGETDETVHLRLKAALDAGLTVILCVGERLEDRENGITEELVAIQTKIALKGLTEEELSRVILAYEPVWAIGTGKTATAQEAQEVCGWLRKVIAKQFGAEVSEKMVIQYGGSMNPKNAAELLEKQDVDGGLIGGASLKAGDFASIVEAASKG